MFAPADIEPASDTAVVPRSAALVDVSENGEVNMRLSHGGIIEFYDAQNGAPISAFSLGIEVRNAQRVYPTVDTYAIVDESDRLHFISTRYIVSFESGELSELTCPSPTQGTYSLQFLDPLTRKLASGLASDVQVRFQDKFPLRLDWNSNDGGASWSYFLAPRVTND